MKNSISVITICFNNLSELQQTCLSVDEQVCPPDEHLIIDGSTNKEIVRWLANTKQPSYRKWIHESDQGIADALNKGIVKSSSTITHLLHSGDKYYDVHVVDIIKKQFDKDEELMWTHSLYVQNRGGVNVITGAPFQKRLLWKGMRTVAHPTMFIKKELYLKHGLYSLDYKIAMDFDLLLRIRDEKFAFIPKALVYFSPGGASNVQFKKGLAEVRKSYKTHVGKSTKLFLWQQRQQLLHLVMQTSLGKILFKLKNKRKITG